MDVDASWPVWVVALIMAAPGLIAALIAAMVAHRAMKTTAATGTANSVKLEQIHMLVNSQLTAVLEKLEAALEEIGRLKGIPPDTIAEAPSREPGSYRDTG